MRITTVREIEIGAGPEVVFDLAASVEGFARFVKPSGPIPGVVSGQMIGGAVPAAGARRVLQMSDGSTVEEEILAFERPGLHHYRWANPPAAPLSWLVRGAESRWVFRPSATGTALQWTYDFTLASPLAFPFALVVVQLFKRWMTQALERIKLAAEQARQR